MHNFPQLLLIGSPKRSSSKRLLYAIWDYAMRRIRRYSLQRARQPAIVMKDSDFVDLVNARGAPPQVIWVTCGNTSNARLREILSKTLPQALALLASGEKVVEIKD